MARIPAERDRATAALTEAQAPLRQVENPTQALVARPQGALVLVALPRFVVARIGWRAVSRVLRLLAWALGITQAPCPHPIIHWVMRLAMVRIDSARLLRGVPLSLAPFRHRLLWMIDSRMGLGTGQSVAVLACDAHPHQLTPEALSLERVHGLGVSVADAWTGDTMAELLGRLIAVRGRPAASLTDGGGDLDTAVAFLGAQGLPSSGLDESAHAVAGMLKRSSHDPPTFETLLAACGRVSGTLTHTILACVAPPTGRTTARFLPVHRLFPWADRVLKLSPGGPAKAGST